MQASQHALIVRILVVDAYAGDLLENAIAWLPRSVLRRRWSSLPRPTRSGSQKTEEADRGRNLPHVSWIKLTQLFGRRVERSPSGT